MGGKIRLMRIEIEMEMASEVQGDMDHLIKMENREEQEAGMEIIMATAMEKIDSIIIIMEILLLEVKRNTIRIIIAINKDLSNITRSITRDNEILQESLHSREDLTKEKISITEANQIEDKIIM
jgi:hypothetical protein